ncbi:MULTISPECIES: PilW family protein [unclassified Polaromonas]|uniref:PilW family protein n=1 Tax=unclassified Polaromonas TaxID=2638319 RepID=UPI0025D604DD|nr:MULTISPECIES: PilW family protein [unclassified Polaromonas]HQR99298.1 PilW family protein [Polaromonas sp.]HQS40504.1 PilW family protein [Polaromonas sp.]HQS88880.1 PilW family protein [Polaromonas sp.]HQT07888.1 PilW family protein [Polaromonas sp.]
MIKTGHHHKTSLSAQSGLSLIELLVSLVISLVIALAAAAAYLGTRSTATAMANIAGMNETGKLALDMVGRELQMAGYYPAIVPTSNVNLNLMGRFSNTKNTAFAAYNQGLFGCDGGVFNPTTGACPAATAGAPDSVVINYFANTELDAATFVSGFDCLRVSVAVDPSNVVQAATGRPFYVSNRFGLTNTNYTKPGPGGTTQTVTTKSLACNGNGKAAEDTVYQPLFEGIEDMTFAYGVHDGTGNLSPQTYYTATEVTALPTVGTLTSWQRVTAVRVCVLTRASDNIRTQDKAGSLRTYTNCRGATVTYAESDRSLYKRYERVFAIRNNLNGTF